MHTLWLIFSNANITVKPCNNSLAKNTNKKQNIWLLIPLFGTIIFACLYFVATLFYPGGSQVDQDSKGFSWMNNYWCNLLNDNAINGQRNYARPIALAAMCILCFTLVYFWYIFSRHAYLKKSNRLMGTGSCSVCDDYGHIHFYRLSWYHCECGKFFWNYCNGRNVYWPLQIEVEKSFLVRYFQSNANRR